MDFRLYGLYGLFILALLSGSFFLVLPAQSATVGKSINGQSSLKTGLVGWWTFDGATCGATYCVDKSGQGITATKSGTPTMSKGKIGQAVSLNGGSQKFTTARVVNYPAMSVNAWVYVKPGITNYSSILDNYDGSENGFSVGWISNGIYAWYFAGSGNSVRHDSDTAAISYNKWTFVTWTLDSSGGKIYLDGVLKKTASWTGTAGTANTASTLTIGEYMNVPNYWKGSIDDARIYNRALSAKEIKQLYQQGGGKIAKSVPSIQQGLVGWWTFDGATCGATYCVDKSVSGDTVTSTSANMPKKSTGKIGQGLNFNGASNYVTAGDKDELIGTNYTYTFWLKPKDITATQNVLSKINGTFTNGIALLLQSPGVLAVYADTGTSDCSTPDNTLTTNRWSFATVIVNSTGCYVYVNGVLKDTGTATATTDNDEAFDIGYRSTNLDRYFNGSIDDVRIYNRALSAQEIKQLYQQGGGKIAKSTSQGGLNSGLVGWWTFDGADVTATKVIDKSGQGNTGTRTGGVAMAAGKIGQGGKFDGVNDYVGKTDFNASQANTSTMSVWFKALATQIENARIFEIGTAADRVGLNIDVNKKLNLYSVKGDALNASLITVASVNDNLWHHAVGTWDGNGANLYIDGVRAATTAGDKGLNMGNSVNMYIGEFVSDGNYYFNGSIDDARIYNRVLSAQEIKQLYQMGK